MNENLLYEINPSELVEKIEHLIEQILDKLLDFHELELYIIDLEYNSKFNYDLGFYHLPEFNEDIKYKTITLYKDSDRIAKIIKLLNIIHMKAVRNLNFSTKRELYYNDVELFKNTISIDNLIHDICSILNISRFELSIFPASKGLFAGDIIIYDSKGEIMNNSFTFEKINLISYEYAIEDFQVETNAKFILVLEKESLFFNVINSSVYKHYFLNSLIITGKGYPDYLTKNFVYKLSQLGIPLLYFGDCDPFGIDIYLNYLFGSKSSSRENNIMSINNLNWIGLSHELIRKIDNQTNTIKLNSEDINKIESILMREYLNIDYWEFSINCNRDILIHNLRLIKNELLHIKESKYKAEGEIIISIYIDIFVENLLSII